MKRLLALLILLIPMSAHGQTASRWDWQAWTINNGNPSPNGLYPVLAIPGASVSICSGNPCTLATSYTDSTATTPCDVTTQLTRGTSTACYGVADDQGGFGAWLLPGNYQYTISTQWGTFGPFPFGVDAAGAYVPIAGGTMTGPLCNKGSLYFDVVACYGADPTFTTDSTTAIQNAINDATAVGGIVKIPPGKYKVNGPIQVTCDAILCVPSVSATAPEDVRIEGTTRVRHDSQSTDASVVDNGSMLVTTTAGLDQASAIIGSPTVPGNFSNLNNLEIRIDGLTFLTYPNPSIGCINAFWMSGANITNVRCWNGEQYYPAVHTEPTNLAYGIILPSLGNDTMVNLEWTEISGFHTGVWASEHAHFDGVWTAYSLVGYEFAQGFYPITGHLGSQENGLPILFTGGLTPGATGLGNTEVQINLGLELDPSNHSNCVAWCYSTTDIQDTQNGGVGIANGFIDYKTTLAGIGNTSNYPIRLSGATHIDFHDEYRHEWSYFAAGTARAPVTIGTLGTTNGDGMYVAQSIQYDGNDMAFGHDDAVTKDATIQAYTGGSGYTLGTGHGQLNLNPYAGEIYMGPGGLVMATGATVQIIGCSAGTVVLADGTGCASVAGVFPSATDTKDTIQVNTSGTASILTPATTGTWEAVQNGGLDNTGSVDASSALAAKINALCASSTPVRVHLAAGTYKINSGILINATSSTCKNLVIEGDGSGNTVLQTDCSGNSYGIWYDNTSAAGAEHFLGPEIRHLQITGTGTTACTAGIRLTQTAGWKINDVQVTGFSGQTYATGTISTSGSAVTGVGTTFTSAMVHGFIEVTSGVATTRAQVCGFTNATSITLCSTGFPTGNLSGSSYALVYGGDAIALDPGTGYTQYGSIQDSYLPGNLVGINAWGTTTGGVSRVSIAGKANYIAPNPSTRITDAVGIYLGKGSDTFEIAGPMNNEAVCMVLESSHGNIIRNECENSSTFAPVTTCNGGVASQNCTQGIEVSSDTNGHGWNNFFDGFYAYLVGTVYRFDNATGEFNASIIGDRTLSGQYTTHYDFSGTTGCPGNASGIPVILSTYDCNHQLVTQTVN